MKKNDFRPNSNHEPALEKFRLSNVIIFSIYNKSLNIKKLSTSLSLVPNVKRTLGNSVAFSISIPQYTCNSFYIFFRIFIVTSSTTLPASSPLLLRNPPHTFAFIPLPAMSLSSLNRSNSKALRPIMPYSAPFCEDMPYHKTGVPWQMKSTFIIVA